MDSPRAKLFAAVLLAVCALAFVIGAPELRFSLVSAPADPEAGRAVPVVVRVVRGLGPVRRAHVVVWITRNGVRRSFAAHSEHNGRFRTLVIFPSAGRWALGARIGKTRMKLGSIRARPAAGV